MNGAASSEAAHYSVWRWAQQTPDAVAIRDQQICITYRDLAARADRLALRLRRAGVQREVLVGLSASRSAALVIGALAILRAGGAYVPIDPAYPAERRDFLLQDSQCQVLLTESEYLPLYAGSSARILVLDDSTSAIDSNTEDQIQRAMRRILEGRTTLLITHRLSQIRWADKIVVLRRGQVAAVGTHEELLAQSQAYRDIFARI